MGLNHLRMKQNGRVHWIGLVALVGIVGLFVLIAFSGVSPVSVAGDFMTALAKGDTNKLTELTYQGQKSKDQIQKQWEFTVNKAAPYYRFTWQMKDEHLMSDKEATVQLDLYRNLGPASYPEHFELPMQKVDGKWKVRVESINREMFPFLPH